MNGRNQPALNSQVKGISEPSRFSQGIGGSKTLAVTAKVAEMKRQGLEVIALGAGEPDFQTPAEVCNAGIRAIREGHTKYTPNAGIYELRVAVAEFLQSLGGDYAPEEILISNGAKQSIYNALLATCDPGDEVLVPAPYWTSYPEQIKMVRATPVILPTSEENNFKIDANTLRRAINSKTRLLILNSPSNPTGMVYARRELQQIVDIVAEFGLLLLSDEIYIRLIYADVDTLSLGAFPTIREQLLLVNGLSKSHAMTGWRLGYLAAKAPFIQAAIKMQSHITSNASSISQYAALAAFQLPDTAFEKMKEAFANRRDFVVSRLNGMTGIKPLKPQGAFYVFPNVSELFGKMYGDRVIKAPMDLTSYLLDEARVAVVPGEAFGSKQNIRISYAASMEDLHKAMDRIEEALQQLN